jgi:hypothetical protein
MCKWGVASVVVMALLATGAMAGPECLVGTWSGNLEGWRGKDGTGRKMIVQPPGPDGVPVVNWGFKETQKPPAVGNVKVSGEKITFVTGPGGKVEASCKGDKITGSWTWESKPYFFTFTKQ